MLTALENELQRSPRQELARLDNKLRHVAARGRVKCRTARRRAIDAARLADHIKVLTDPPTPEELEKAAEERRMFDELMADMFDCEEQLAAACFNGRRVSLHPAVA